MADEIVDVNKWVQEVVKPLVRPVLEGIDAEAVKFGDDMSLYIVEGVLQLLIAALVRATLTDDYSDFEDQGKAVTRAFAVLQATIQAGVSGGLSNGVQSATGEALEYWCAIKLVAATANREPS